MKLIQPGKENLFMDALRKIRGHEPASFEERIRLSELVRATVLNFMVKSDKEIRQRTFDSLRASVQAFTTKSDVPDFITNISEYFLEAGNYDMGYEQAYKVAPIDEGREFWEIADVTNGVTFRKLQEGEPVIVERFEGKKTTVYVDRYGGAMGWDDELIRFRKLAQIVDKTEMFKQSFFKDKADRHYLLLKNAATGYTTSWDSTGATVLDKDINTINNGVNATLLGLKDLFQGINVSALPIVMIAKNAMRARLLRALAATFQTPNLQNQVVYQMIPIFTFNANMPTADTDVIFAVPGLKTQRGTVAEPFVLSDQDILSLSYISACYSYYGAAVAEAKQLRTVHFA